MRFPDQGLSWFFQRYRVRLVIRAAGRCREILRYGLVRPRRMHRFHIVSTQRNMGEAVLRCLQSVHEQDYPRELVTHLLIDDASTDGTRATIEGWLADHPDHRVDFVTRSTRRGGTDNTLDGLKRAKSDAIVVELNGDDWLPDTGVLGFLNKVYQSPEVWMTYNTLRQADGIITIQLPPPRKVRRDRSYRRAPWSTSHLHSFRRPLFDHVPDDEFIDEATGDLLESADDVALYLRMLELAGAHAIHIWRVTCVSTTSTTRPNTGSIGPASWSGKSESDPGRCLHPCLRWTSRPRPDDPQQSERTGLNHVRHRRDYLRTTPRRMPTNSSGRPAPAPSPGSRRRGHHPHRHPIQSAR